MAKVSWPIGASNAPVQETEQSMTIRTLAAVALLATIASDFMPREIYAECLAAEAAVGAARLKVTRAEEAGAMLAGAPTVGGKLAEPPPPEQPAAAKAVMRLTVSFALVRIPQHIGRYDFCLRCRG